MGDMPIGRHECPSFFGEIQVLTEDRVPVTLTADMPTELYELNCCDFLDLVHSCREFARDIFPTVGKRLRGLESFVQTREKMAALGTLSAGLAHELNDPAAALVRMLKDVQSALMELQRMNLVYGQRQVDEAHTQEWTDVRDRGFEAIAHLQNDPLEQGDREDALTDWLEDYGVDEAWKLSEPLAAGAVEPAMLEHLMERWRGDTSELRVWHGAPLKIAMAAASPWHLDRDALAWQSCCPLPPTKPLGLTPSLVPIVENPMVGRGRLDYSDRH